MIVWFFRVLSFFCWWCLSVFVFKFFHFFSFPLSVHRTVLSFFLLFSIRQGKRQDSQTGYSLCWLGLLSVYHFVRSSLSSSLSASLSFGPFLLVSRPPLFVIRFLLFSEDCGHTPFQKYIYAFVWDAFFSRPRQDRDEEKKEILIDWYERARKKDTWIDGWMDGGRALFLLEGIAVRDYKFIVVVSAKKNARSSHVVGRDLFNLFP